MAENQETLKKSSIYTPAENETFEQVVSVLYDRCLANNGRAQVALYNGVKIRIEGVDLEYPKEACIAVHYKMYTERKNYLESPERKKATEQKAVILDEIKNESFQANFEDNPWVSSMRAEMEIDLDHSSAQTVGYIWCCLMQMEMRRTKETRVTVELMEETATKVVPFIENNAVFDTAFQTAIYSWKNGKQLMCPSRRVTKYKGQARVCDEPQGHEQRQD